VELRHLRYFVALAEELHFGRAAQRLHIVQPALSKQVIALERELGVDLIDRAHGVKLTRAGELFYAEAREIVDRADRAVDATRATARGEQGLLRIGFVAPAMWSVLPVVLRAHRRLYPELTYRLYEAPTPEHLEQLRANALDVGFVRPPSVDDALAFELVWREPFVVVLPDDHRLAREDAIDLADLANERFVVMPRANAMVNDVIVSICLSYGFSPKVVEEGNSPSSLVMVAMGQCVALVPVSLQDCGVRGITFRPLIRPTPELDLAVAYRRDDRSLALRAFLETARRVAPEVEAHGYCPLGPDQGAVARARSHQRSMST
jgi:DNA-binding transcriptional LysR family regulator